MRKINVTSKPAKPATAKPASKPAKPVTAAVSAKPVPATTDAATVAPAVAKPIRGVAATARTIAAQATHFGGLSDRDTAYLGFYAGIAKRNGGTCDIAAIALAGTRPAYDGSNKPHDAGVIVRLTKAGLAKPATDGRSFTFTDLAKTHAAYASAK